MDFHPALGRLSHLPGGRDLAEIVERVMRLDGAALARLALARSEPDPPTDLVLLRSELVVPDFPNVADLLDLYTITDAVCTSPAARLQVERYSLGLIDDPVELAAAAVRDALTGALAAEFLDPGRTYLLMGPWWRLAA